VRELPAPGIPEQFGALPTDVIEVGKITAYQNPRDRHRPAPCSVSVGHPRITAGTLGCLVEKEGNHYILSNNHVLAASNTAEPGNKVIQPGSVDGGSSPDDDIATLEPYQEIDFSQDEKNPNLIDAAIALVGDCNQTLVVPEIIDIGLPRSSTRTALIGQTVQKHGRTTGHTVGVVKAIDADVTVNYKVGDQELLAQFDRQIEVQRDGSTPFSEGGDSGSLIVDAETREPVALLFAGGEKNGVKSTFANPIDLVLQHYGVTVVGE